MLMSKSKFSEPTNAQYYGFIPVALLMILLFASYVITAYVVNQKGPVQEEVVNQRIETLNDVRSSQEDLITNYAAINIQEGVYRIPVHRAMELTLKDLKK